MATERDILHTTKEQGQIQFLSVDFARRVRTLYRQAYPLNYAERKPLDQMYRAATSVAANIRESQYAESPRDFVHKIKIAEKELGEFFFWFGLLSREPETFLDTDAEDIVARGSDIKRLISSIILTTRRKHNL